MSEDSKNPVVDIKPWDEAILEAWQEEDKLQVEAVLKELDEAEAGDGPPMDVLKDSAVDSLVKKGWKVCEAIAYCSTEKPKDVEVPGGSTPSQYRFPEGLREVQDLIEHRDMNFAVGNIFKACYRMNNCTHSDAIRDLNKILWFAKRELHRVTHLPPGAATFPPS